MPCLVSCLALFAPRLVMVLLWIFSDWLGTAYQTTIWPLLGFVFLPYTTLAYAWAWHRGQGSIEGLGLIVLVIAVLVDLGVIGGSSHGENRRRVRTIVVRER